MKPRSFPLCPSVAVLCLLGLASAVQAEDLTWVNKPSGTTDEWNKTPNWSGNAIPTTPDIAIFASGDTVPTTAGKTLIMPNAVTLAGLTLSNNYSFNIGNGTTLNSFSVINLNKAGSGTVAINTTNAAVTATNVSITNPTGSLNFTNGLSATNVTGIGTIGGAVTISGTHAVGVGTNTVGTQAFSNTLEYGENSIFEWNIEGVSSFTGLNDGNYDKVTSGQIAGSNAIFNIANLGSYDSPFWASDQIWEDIFQLGNPQQVFAGGFGGDATVAGVVSGKGSFSWNGAQLTWAAVPEPSSALAGLLLCAGLLRRKRH